MKLTHRQETFILRLLDLCRETKGPIHYSTLAEKVGVSPFTAYDMLRLLEEKGFVTSEYRIEPGKANVGRSEILFLPTQLTYDRFSELTTGADQSNWEEVKSQILARIRAGDVYDRNLAEEVDEIVTIVISHHMSATIQSAEMAKEQFHTVPVHIIDSESVSLGLGLMTLAAARAAQEGQDAQAVIKLVQELKQKISVIFTVETLEYLYKGGRIGGATAFLGSALNIKPILYIKDGRIEPLEKQRTRKRSISRLLELMEESVGKQPVHLAILHGNAPEEAYQMEQSIRSRFNCAELITSDMGPVIGVHAGPGTLGLVFYTNEEKGV